MSEQSYLKNKITNLNKAIKYLKITKHNLKNDYDQNHLYNIYEEPLSANENSWKYYVMEGLEDAINKLNIYLKETKIEYKAKYLDTDK
jgi:hypothetical protein